MEKIKRILNIDLPSRQSAFLWGPRKTGKSTYLKEEYDFSKEERCKFFRNDIELKFPVYLDIGSV
jgi:predicted AAA+ superfamily ATPase